jgi:type IV pilus assembly protein PilN
MKVRLNIATNPLQTHRKFLAASGVIGVIAAIVCLGLSWHVYSVRKANEALRARAAAVREEMVGLMGQRDALEAFFKEERNAKLNQRSTFINSLIDEESLNWTQMFMDLEKILPTGVRLVSIEPTHDKGQVLVKLQIGAISDEAKLKFLRALENSPAFKEVRVEHEIFSDPQEPGGGGGDLDRLHVQLTALYVRS